MSRASSVGLLHPGEMGAAVGGALVAAGHEVLWASEGRSQATAQRAAKEGLTDVRTVSALADRAAVILSICPPRAATEVAACVAGFEGVYVDANAVAPGTVSEVAARLAARFVDGAIIGPPPRAAGTTRLYLAGEDASLIAALFAATPLEAIVLGGPVGAASALKMTYAAWTKGTAALLLAIHETAERQGVAAELTEEWARSQPHLAEQLAAAERAAASKGWRWEHEMREIAATFAAAGQPDGFHLAAAEVYAERPVTK